MGMPSGARVPVAAMDNSRSKGSRKGSNLITVIAASSSCDVCRTCPGAGGDHPTSPEASHRGACASCRSPPVPARTRAPAPWGRVGLAGLLTACRPHQTAFLRWRGQIGHLFRAGHLSGLDLPEDQPNPGNPLGESSPGDARRPRPAPDPALSCCEAAKDSRAPSCTRFEFGQLPIRSRAATRSSMVWAPPQARQLKQRDVGMLQAEISSFRLHLAAGGKSAKTIRTYTDAVQWFAPDCLLP